MKPGTAAAVLSHSTNLLLVLAAAQDDAADVVAPVALRSRDDSSQSASAVEPLDLPDVWIDAGVLQLTNGAGP